MSNLFGLLSKPNRTKRNWLAGVISGVKHTPLMSSYPQHNQELSDTAVDGDIEVFAIPTKLRKYTSCIKQEKEKRKGEKMRK